MQPTAILYPVFVQVAMTFGLQVWMARERVASVRQGEVKVSDIALRQQAWPARATQVANAFHNQLELPMLFYAVAAFALITSRVDIVLVVLAWLFVALRLVHAAIHTTSNAMRHRFNVFTLASLALIAMWVYFAVQILTAPTVA